MAAISQTTFSNYFSRKKFALWGRCLDAMMAWHNGAYMRLTDWNSWICTDFISLISHDLHLSQLYISYVWYTHTYLTLWCTWWSMARGLGFYVLIITVNKRNCNKVTFRYYHFHCKLSSFWQSYPHFIIYLNTHGKKFWSQIFNDITIALIMFQTSQQLPDVFKAYWPLYVPILWKSSQSWRNSGQWKRPKSVNIKPQFGIARPAYDYYAWPHDHCSSDIMHKTGMCPPCVQWCHGYSC